MPSVTRRSSSKRAERRRDIVAQLMTTVEERLADGESFAEVSVEQLITSAGISRSTFYVYFEDKGTLLLALAEGVVQRLVGTADAWWSLPADAGRDDVEKALRGIMDIYHEHSTIWGALVDGASYDTRVRESFQQVVALATTGLERHIREGQKAGSVRPDLDPKRTAAWLTWMTERGMYQLTPGATPAEITKLCRAQTAIVWYTLYEGTPSRAA